MKTITVSITCTVNRLSAEQCERFNRPLGTIEVISEGYRVAFAETMEEAINAARGMVGSDLETTITLGA